MNKDDMVNDTLQPTTLSGEINAATRSLHTNLNRLITSRLPLSLPPHATDPTPYITGLIHFAHIFLTFESLWADLTPVPSATSPPPTSPLLSFLLVNPYDTSDPHSFISSPPTLRMIDFLRDLRPTGLTRSARLKGDLEALTGLTSTDLSVLLAQYPGDKVAQYCAHIRSVVGRKPHTLVAYAWCYYMAVFSGGRWIRGELLKATPEFWRAAILAEDSNEGTPAVPLSERGLSLWHFDGAFDGEDIKSEFKLRLSEAETFFTEDERIDVIEEAKQIFVRSAQLVYELDEQLGTDIEALRYGETRQTPKPQHHASAKENGADGEKNDVTVPKDLSQAIVMWLKRPEVTGTVVALGCLLCVALLSLEDFV
ncbi:heme oxygenase-like protein [Pleomassaria siparia CBS 279.74]|uniref:Heme oxygenase-like protein n=1 Tax=Pleomassaria siparia CBS 279.74 TaxID=1314801 RepID=A0A6G1KD10_9PLEO|nr:heme oxygenase-like protein [Pleomassaria siparia CBS 279.74]